MHSFALRIVLCSVAVAWLGQRTPADEPAYTHKEDVIYGRKHGLALTMDVFTPRQHANGIGVILTVSGGWVASHDWIGQPFIRAYIDGLVKRGYTVFAVVPGSQPRFSIPEIVEDMHRAVRFIRAHASDYKIDPDHIGITGGSAGGHLSLMAGTTGKAGDPGAKDPVERVSSRVQAVACFFPPTDFLNYGKKGEDALGRGTLAGFKPPFDFVERDKKTGAFRVVEDEGKRRQIGKQISPALQATKESAPSLIIHGDADKLVPIQQAEEMVAKLKEAGVPAELVVKKGAAHGWAGMDKDMKTIADWFDRYLLKKKGPAAAPAPGAARGSPQRPPAQARVIQAAGCVRALAMPACSRRGAGSGSPAL